MARLIYHRPKFAILDECTSATSIESEGPIYEYVKSVGITLLTVSHRPNLWKYHQMMLKFSDDQTYEYIPMEEALKKAEEAKSSKSPSPSKAPSR